MSWQYENRIKYQTGANCKKEIKNNYTTTRKPFKYFK
jgi:hypothetical protein